MLLPCKHLRTDSQEKKQKNRGIRTNDREVRKTCTEGQKPRKSDQRKLKGIDKHIEEDSADESDSFEGFYPNDLRRSNESREVADDAPRFDLEPEHLEQESFEGTEDSTENSDQGIEEPTRCPQRNRRPPQMLTYYGPGQSVERPVGNISLIYTSHLRPNPIICGLLYAYPVQTYPVQY